MDMTATGRPWYGAASISQVAGLTFNGDTPGSGDSRVAWSKKVGKLRGARCRLPSEIRSGAGAQAPVRLPPASHEAPHVGALYSFPAS